MSALVLETSILIMKIAVIIMKTMTATNITDGATNGAKMKIGKGDEVGQEYQG